MLDRKIKIVENILGNWYRSKDEFLFHCPKCKHHKRKLSINFDKDVFKCWICDYTGRMYYLVSVHGSANNREAWKEISGIVDMSEVETEPEEEQQIDLPKQFISLTGNKNMPMANRARKYLSDRGVSFEDVLWWKIGFCPDGEYGGRIIIPSFDMKGDVNYFIARSYENNWKRYLNPPSKKDFIFNELFIDWDEDVVLVEGVFDAIVAKNAIPLLGSTLREKSYLFQKIVEKCKKVYIALDADATKKEEKIISLLLSYGVECYKIDTSGFDDVGEMNKKTFEERKKEGSFVSLDNYLLKRLSI